MMLTVGPADDPEEVGVADLVTLRISLGTAQDLVQSAVNSQEMKRGQLVLAKRSLLDVMQSFGRRVRAMFPPGSPWLGMLPEMPEMSSAAENFLNPARDVRDIWQKIETAGDPLTLPGGVTRAAYGVELLALETLFQQAGAVELDLRYQRELRNALQARTELVLNRYRPTVESLLPPGSPLVLTIPKLRPSAGHTPDAVAITAVWDAVAGKARITWEASEDAELATYQVRMSPTLEYDADAESIIATVAPGDPRELLTLAGLGSAGDSASYKVYVILTTGNERGSTPVAVTRP